MRRLVLVLLLAAPLAVPVRAQVRARLDDLRLATAVRIALVDDVRTRALDVDVTARDGDVAVAGDVPPADRRLVAEVAQRVRGVRRLEGLGTLTEPPATPAVTLSDRREAPSRTADGPVYHTVQAGDTLFSLARRYETTVEAILALNNRESTAIQVGRRLRVR